ncbi:hypothetical protein LY76DRAFT_601939 [Colletotrichum caudatum]|nr:hypothetical protein LY76DRAFT_601939 [Colletotrichum caudatum]
MLRYYTATLVFVLTNNAAPALRPSPAGRTTGTTTSPGPLRQKTRKSADAICAASDSIPKGCYAETSMIFPLFMAGGEAETVQHFEVIRGGAVLSELPSEVPQHGRLHRRPRRGLEGGGGRDPGAGSGKDVPLGLQRRSFAEVR